MGKIYRGNYSICMSSQQQFLRLRENSRLQAIEKTPRLEARVPRTSPRDTPLLGVAKTNTTASGKNRRKENVACVHNIHSILKVTIPRGGIEMRSARPPRSSRGLLL